LRLSPLLDRRDCFPLEAPKSYRAQADDKTVTLLAHQVDGRMRLLTETAGPVSMLLSVRGGGVMARYRVQVRGGRTVCETDDPAEVARKYVATSWDSEGKRVELLVYDGARRLDQGEVAELLLDNSGEGGA
jgi:hypothetical protein